MRKHTRHAAARRSSQGMEAELLEMFRAALRALAAADDEVARGVDGAVRAMTSPPLSSCHHTIYLFFII